MDALRCVVVGTAKYDGGGVQPPDVRVCSHRICKEPHRSIGQTAFLLYGLEGGRSFVLMDDPRGTSSPPGS